VPTLGLALLEKAAGQGHAHAMLALGDIHGSWKEHERAVEWYTKGAEAGVPQAMFSLGASLDAGEGVAAPNYPAAASWYRRAADAGHGGAAFNLSTMYNVGCGRAWRMTPARPSFLELGGATRRGEQNMPGPRARRHAEQAAGGAMDAAGC
jgi:TPR repeat protein